MTAPFDHHSEDFARNWRATCAELRARCPVAHTDRHGGYYVVTRYDDVLAVLRDARSASSSRAMEAGRPSMDEGVTIPPGGYYNEYFPGHSIAMPPPLTDGRVDYTDGSPATVDQYSKDVAAFMMWAAEPHLEARKRIGFQVMIFLIIFAGLMYFTKEKVWADVH